MENSFSSKQSSSRTREAESLMADENVNTGDENKSTAVWYDLDESEDKWLPPNGEMAEFAQSDEGGTSEAIGLDDMQSFGEDWYIGCTESVAEEGTDEGGTGEASGQEDIQSSSDTCCHHSVEDYATSSSPSGDVDITGWDKMKGNIGTEIYNILKRHGPQKAEEYINKHLNRWKTEKIRFAVMGQSDTGKSSFINRFRGVKVDQEGFADVGYGNTTKTISEYRHPLNKNIMFCDFPGFSSTFTEQKFQEMVILSKYSYVFIFLSGVPSEHDKGLMKQMKKQNIPFCLVRSKIDDAVNCGMRRQISETEVMRQIREAITNSLAGDKDLATVKVFLISSENPHIGEMSNLQEHMKKKLPASKFSAIILSLPILTGVVIDSKLLELKKRMPYISIGTAIIASVTNPIFNISTSIALVKREVWRYVTTFGLNQLHDEHIEGLKHNFSNEVFVDQFVESKFTTMYSVERKECIPIFGLVFVGNKTKKIVDEFLSYVLTELTEDAHTMYMHLLNKNIRKRPII